MVTHGDRSRQANASGRRRFKQIGAVVALGLTALLMSGCSAQEAMRFGWPEGITPEAEDMRHLWTWSVIAALVMGIIVWALTFWTITFHRRKRNSPATAESTPGRSATFIDT